MDNDHATALMPYMMDRMYLDTTVAEEIDPTSLPGFTVARASRGALLNGACT